MEGVISVIQKKFLNMKNLTRKITGIFLITIIVTWDLFIGDFLSSYKFNEWGTSLLIIPAFYCVISFFSPSKQSQKKRAMINILGVILLLLLLFIDRDGFCTLKALKIMATLLGLVIVLIVNNSVQKNNATASWLSYFDWWNVNSDTK